MDWRCGWDLSQPPHVDPLGGFAPGLAVEGSLCSILGDCQVESSPNLFLWAWSRALDQQTLLGLPGERFVLLWFIPAMPRWSWLPVVVPGVFSFKSFLKKSFNSPWCPAYPALSALWFWGGALIFPLSWQENQCVLSAMGCPCPTSVPRGAAELCQPTPKILLPGPQKDQFTYFYFLLRWVEGEHTFFFPFPVLKSWVSSPQHFVPAPQSDFHDFLIFHPMETSRSTSLFSQDLCCSLKSTEQ